VTCLQKTILRRKKNLDKIHQTQPKTPKKTSVYKSSMVTPTPEPKPAPAPLAAMTEPVPAALSEAEQREYDAMMAEMLALTPLSHTHGHTGLSASVMSSLGAVDPLARAGGVSAGQALAPGLPAGGLTPAMPPPVPPLHALPLRLYLEATILPLLVRAMEAAALSRPADPLEFLAAYLLSNNPQRQSPLPVPPCAALTGWLSTAVDVEGVPGWVSGAPVAAGSASAVGGVGNAAAPPCSAAAGGPTSQAQQRLERQQRGAIAEAMRSRGPAKVDAAAAAAARSGPPFSTLPAGAAVPGASRRIVEAEEGQI
jgi:hypothetical protein